MLSAMEISKMYRRARNTDNGEECESYWDDIRRGVPKKLQDILAPLRDETEFLRAVWAFDEKPKPKTPGPSEDKAEPKAPKYPDVLPWPPNREGAVDFPDYGIDFRSIPHGLGGKRGRKKGELSMDRYYRGSQKFISRYRLSHRDGVRRSLTPAFCARMRTHAEAVYKKERILGVPC